MPALGGGYKQKEGSGKSRISHSLACSEGRKGHEKVVMGFRTGDSLKMAVANLNLTTKEKNRTFKTTRVSAQKQRSKGQ